MNTSATNSSIDVAYWFFKRAERDNVYLENDKLHYLLFTSQSRYAQTHHHGMLMPCLFLCDENGFFEPTLKRIFEQGRPFMPDVSFDTEISSFLEQIWADFHSLSLNQCKQQMINLPLYADCHRKGAVTVVPSSLLQTSTMTSPTSAMMSTSSFHKKILVSQNGPVVVSQWTPRKINK